MTNTGNPLQNLAQRISQQQAQLEKLRKEYEARQNQLSDLTRRKASLLNQLKQVEAEIQGLGRGNPAGSKPSAAKPAGAKPVAKPTATISLAQLLVQIVAEAGRPVTVKELTSEVIRRKYPTTSNNLSALVEKRVHELVKKGFFQRATNQPGVLPARPKETPKAPVKPTATTPATASKTPAVAKPATPTPPTTSGSDLSLHAVVTKILAQSSEPIPARELAKKVLAAGYQTKSKSLTDVIWAGVGKWDDVEKVPGKGYRLKKAKIAVPMNVGKSSK